jgi:hypothetical protein
LGFFVKYMGEWSDDKMEGLGKIVGVQSMRASGRLAKWKVGPIFCFVFGRIYCFVIYNNNVLNFISSFYIRICIRCNLFNV